MPLPMVHLSIAFELAEELGFRDDRSLYYLGAIAPDGIHSRQGATREDKRRVHLASGPTQPLRDRLQLIDDFRSEWRSTVDEHFLLGWTTHLVADSVWSRHLVEGVWSKETAELDQQERRRRYYDEADQADFNLYNHAPWRSAVWKSLENTEAPALGDILTSAEIAAWRDRVVKWFTETKEEPKIDLSVITMRRISRFVEINVQLLKAGIDRGLATSVELIPGIEDNELLSDV